MRGRLGFLFQGGALFDSETVFENVAFPLRERTKLGEPEIRKKVMDLLEQVDLIGSENKYPAQLSGGMVKRAAFARALVTNPEIMLFDEPTTGLDPIIACAILNLIESLHSHFGFTGILVTHEIPSVFRFVQKVAMLHEGKILMVQTPEEIQSSMHPIIQQFIAGCVEGPIPYH